MNDTKKQPTRQALELQKVAYQLLLDTYYTDEDYVKFCKANNLTPYINYHGLKIC